MMRFRRLWATKTLAKVSDRWPIDPSAAKPQEGWLGWPEGKRFALVLTHDVESARGQERCLELMRLELEAGFRSSFNFVADQYTNHTSLFDELRNHDCEIALHGLRHNENLFKSRKHFTAQIPRINKVLQDWKAAGFRTPCMYHNLEWTRELDIEYDASTFDTDPFEPQPDGVGTVFPFWVAGSGRRGGYVEIPYTLPQDFTLFVLFQEKNIETWKMKLRWIAERGGMAHLITHPDYMNFADGKGNGEQYPAGYYREFLEHLEKEYRGQYWLALPRDIARFCAANEAVRNAPWRRKIRACMLSYSFYESDNRVMRYAEALAKRGDDVDVISLREKGQAEFGTIRGVDVYRIQERVRDEKGKLDYLLRLGKFFLQSAAFLTSRHWKNPYQLIHVHSVPDFEVFATLIAKLGGARVILDIHDIVPEFYASKFNANERNILFKSLVAVERASTRYADHVIISNDIWEKKLLARSVKPEKCSVFLNYPDPSLFYRRPRVRNDGQFVMIYPGTLNWHQGLDIAIKAFASVKDEIPEAEFRIYGSGSMKQELRELAGRLGLNGRVILKDSVPIEKIADIMADADLGVVPKRNSAFGGEAFSTKILEFLTLGVPVIVSDTKIDRFYFKDDVVRFFRSGDESDLARAMKEMAADEKLRKEIGKRGIEFAQEFSWDRRKQEYFRLVDRLIGVEDDRR